MVVNRTDRYRRAVGLFPTRNAAERAVEELRDAGVDMERVSIVAKDADEVSGVETGLDKTRTETEEVGNHADDGALTGALTGGALGGVGGLLVGLGVLAIPGIGPILLAGAEATAIATTLAGTAIGAATGGLLGALVGLGIPEERAKVYSDRVSSGDFLVMINGPEREIGLAETVMRRNNAEEFEIYDSKGSALDEPNNLKLYEERLAIEKNRVKSGAVNVGKRVETETQKVSIPVEKERIVIERTGELEGRAVAPGSASFNEGEVKRVEVYEEKANIDKQAFVREEVSVRKEVERDTVTGKETLRREELEVKTKDDPDVRHI